MGSILVERRRCSRSWMELIRRQAEIERYRGSLETKVPSTRASISFLRSGSSGSGDARRSSVALTHEAT